jgi:antitoxin component of MazEF toxin-antitoxin module
MMAATTKLTKIGNSTGVAIPKEVLEAAHMARGEEVTLTVAEGKIEIAKPIDGYNEAIQVGRRFTKRYAKTMAALAK